MNNSASRSLLLALALLAPAATPVSAIVVGTYQHNLDGSVTYSYAVDNTAGAFDISAWSLDLPIAIPDWDQLDTYSGGGVGVPSLDWIASPGNPVTGLSAQDFLSLSPLSDVLIGDILGGFSFTSFYQPELVTYYEYSAAGESSSGTTFAPVSARNVPDTGGGQSLIAIVALAAFAAVSRRHRAELRTFGTH